MFSLTTFLPTPATNRCSRSIMFSGYPSVSASVRPFMCACVHLGMHPVSMISYKPVVKLWLMMQLRLRMNWLHFEGRGVKVKVTTRSDIW